MDLSLNKEQLKLQKDARDFLGRECPWTLVKEIDKSDSRFSKELWKKTVDMGWVGLPIPKKCGGKGGSITDLGILYEEMGLALLPGPYFSSLLCGFIIDAIASEEQKQAILPGLACGEKILSLALTEPDYGWGPECIHLTAVAKGGDFILSGTKRYVHDAQIADQLICVARTRESSNPANGISLFLVNKNTPGISCRSISAYSGERFNEVTFNSVKVQASNILGAKDKGWVSLQEPLNKATVILCAYMVGGSQRIFDMTVERAKERVQFGQPIGAFQWVQTYIIGQANQVEKARWLTYEALWKIDAEKPAAVQNEAVSLAKAAASYGFHECGHLAHEVHAGKGVQKDYPLYLYSKQAKTLYSYLGNPDHHKKRVAQILGL